MDFEIIIDSCCDLPADFIKKNNLITLPFRYSLGDEELEDDFGVSVEYSEFYNKMRNGNISKTTQVNSNRYYEEFKKHILLKKSIIYICFSSALSGSYNSAIMAKNDLQEEYNYADISIVDSKSASLGLGLLIYNVVKMKDKGYSKEELVTYIEKTKYKVSHYFTVDDLIYLYRGGRVSKTKAKVSSVLNIKPILHVDDHGRLIPFDKVKGRKKSIRKLMELMENNIEIHEENTIAISHGDCLGEALKLKDIIEEKYRNYNIIINQIGPVIGSHSGPGTLAIFFISNNR
ncbi:MAG: DegV family protein [Clostridiaceae bacterium]